MITTADVSAVLVTRGDVDLTRIRAELVVFDDVVIWDNSQREDLKTFGRYAAIAEVKHDVLFFQDDDILLPRTSLTSLLAAYEPGMFLANMSQGWVDGRDLHDSVFVGAGGLVSKETVARSLEKYDTMFERDELFHYYPETILTIPSRIKRVDLPFEVLPWGYAENRMVNHERFVADLAESIRRGRAVRDAFGGKS